MKKVFFFLGILILVTIEYSIAQNNNKIPKQFCISIDGKGYEGAEKIIQTKDGGFVLVGYTSPIDSILDSLVTYVIKTDSLDIYVIKIDAFGNLLWSKTIGGNKWDCAYSIIGTKDGGLAIAGITKSFGAGDWDVFIVKLDANGNLLWSKTIGGNDSDEAYSIIETKDGGLAIAGETNSFGDGKDDFFIVKLDANGNLLWSKTIGGEYFDYAKSIIETKDGGLAIAGRTKSFGAFSYDVFIVKLDVNGNLLWSKTIGGNKEDWANSIIETKDGGLAIAGETSSFGAGFNDVFIVKLDANGNLLWSKTIGGNKEWANSIIETKDGGLAIAGRTESFGAGFSDVFIVKLDVNGNLLWSKTIGGNKEDWANSIIETKDGGLAIAGSTESFGAGKSDFFIIKLKSNGKFIDKDGCTSQNPPTTINLINPELKNINCTLKSVECKTSNPQCEIKNFKK
jgi:hypothetical protein